MAFDLEEQEKIDRLKAWWEQWGNLLSGLILAILLAILGWYAWNWYQGYQTRGALSYYEVVEANYRSSEPSSKQRLVEANKVLQDSYKGNLYAGRGALLAARSFSQDGDFAAAEVELQRVLDNPKKYPELVGAATLQLATVYIDQAKYDAASALLAQDVAGYEALYADKRGDIYFSQGEVEKAAAEWSKAAAAQGLSPEFVQTMQFKLNVLGGFND